MARLMYVNIIVYYLELFSFPMYAEVVFGIEPYVYTFILIISKQTSLSLFYNSTEIYDFHVNIYIYTTPP